MAAEVMTMPRDHNGRAALALGEMLETTRQRRLLTQEEAVAQIGCSVSTYQRLCAGQPVSLHTLRVVARWLPYSDSEIREAMEKLRETRPKA